MSTICLKTKLRTVVDNPNLPVFVNYIWVDENIASSLSLQKLDSSNPPIVISEDTGQFDYQKAEWVAGGLEFSNSYVVTTFLRIPENATTLRYKGLCSGTAGFGFYKENKINLVSGGAIMARDYPDEPGGVIMSDHTFEIPEDAKYVKVTTSLASVQGNSFQIIVHHLMPEM